LVFDVAAGSELWGRLGHDRIETAWLRGGDGRVAIRESGGRSQSSQLPTFWGAAGSADQRAF
jgi:hypothetical protein